MSWNNGTKVPEKRSRERKSPGPFAQGNERTRERIGEGAKRLGTSRTVSFVVVRWPQFLRRLSGVRIRQWLLRDVDDKSVLPMSDGSRSDARSSSDAARTTQSQPAPVHRSRLRRKSAGATCRPQTTLHQRYIYAAFYWACELVFTVNTTCKPVPNRSRELEIS